MLCIQSITMMTGQEEKSQPQPTNSIYRRRIWNERKRQIELNLKKKRRNTNTYKKVYVEGVEKRMKEEERAKKNVKHYQHSFYLLLLPYFFLLLLFWLVNGIKNRIQTQLFCHERALRYNWIAIAQQIFHGMWSLLPKLLKLNFICKH